MYDVEPTMLRYSTLAWGWYLKEFVSQIQHEGFDPIAYEGVLSYTI